MARCAVLVPPIDHVSNFEISMSARTSLVLTFIELQQNIHHDVSSERRATGGHDGRIGQQSLET